MGGWDGMERNRRQAVARNEGKRSGKEKEVREKDCLVTHCSRMCSMNASYC